MKTKRAHESLSGATATSRTRLRDSLKLKLLTWFLVVALVPLTVVSTISYYSARASLRNAAFDSIAHEVGEKAGFFNNWLRYRLIDLESQATSMDNTQFLQELHDAFGASGKDLGEFIKSYRWNDIADQRSEDLKTFHRLYEYYDIFLIDADGNILYTVAGESDLGTNLFNGAFSDTRFAAACRKAFDNGRPVFSDLEYYAPSNDAAAAFIAQVMVDEDGRKIGVFAIQITPEQIEYALRSEDGSGRDIRGYVIGLSSDADGVTLRSRLDVDVPTDDGVPRRDSQLDGPARYLDQHVDTAQTRLWLREHGPDGTEDTNMTEDVFAYDGPGGARVLGIHKDCLIAGVHWGLIAEIPEAVAFASAVNLRNLMVVLVLGTGAGVLIIAGTTAQRIVGPIARLSRAAQLVAQGDLTQTIDSETTDEIGELGRSFNEMVANLNNLFSELADQKAALDEHAIVSIANVQGDITYVNDKFCKLSGYSQEELLGQNHRIVQSGVHPPEFFQELWSTISKGEVWQGEVKDRSKDGSNY